MSRIFDSIALGEYSEESNQATTRPRVPSDILDGRLLLPAPSGRPVSEGYIAISDLWQILRKRRVAILAPPLIIAGLVAIACFLMRPVYKAISRVQVEAETPLVQSLNQMYQETQTDDSFLQTQLEVLKSDALAWQTIQSLKLGENPTFIDSADVAADPEKRKVDLISRFENSLAIELVPKTRVISIGFKSHDPKLAARVSSALADNYIDYSFQQKYKATRDASAWMEQQLGDLKAKVQKSQEALVNYERQHSIVNTGEKRNLQEQILSELSSNLTLAKNERIQKQSLYDQVLTNPSRTAKLAHNPLLERLEEKYADQKAEFAQVRAQYGPNHPKVLHQQQQLAEMAEQIAQEQGRVIERTRIDYETSKNWERLLTAAVNTQKLEVERNNEFLVQHNILERDFESNQEIYQNLLRQLKDSTISAGLHSGNLRLIDSALPPTKPVWPKTPQSIAVGFVAGLLLGVLLAYIRETLDQSVKSIQEVESVAALPALGVIPLRRRGHGAYGLLHHSSGANRTTRDVGLTVATEPNSVVAEAYRSLRTAILLSSGPRVPRTILITSAQACEGKSATALNLAQLLAQQKGSVLLIDADMRKPSIDKSLELWSDKGLSTVLAGEHELDEAIQHSSALPQLSVLIAGPIPNNPTELLSSDQMTLMLKECMQRFDHVVIDSPPVLRVTDAAIMSRLMDGVILVVEGGRTAKGALLRARKILSASGARLLGVALNKFNTRTQDYYGYGEIYPYAHEGSGRPERH